MYSFLLPTKCTHNSHGPFMPHIPNGFHNLLTVSGSVLTEGFNLRSCCAQRQSTNNHLYKTLSQLDLPNIPYGSISYLTMTSGIRTVLPKWWKAFTKTLWLLSSFQRLPSPYQTAGNSRSLGIRPVTAWDSGHSPRWRQSPAGGDFPRPTPTTPGGSPPTAPTRPPSTPHSPAQRLTWEGTGPGLPSRRRERAASRRSRADERAQAAPTSASLRKL